MAKYTITQIESLRNAIASGVLLIDHAGTRTRYRDLDEMRLILFEMESDLDAEINGARSKRTVAVYNSGTQS